MILAGDIGGTKTDLAVFRRQGDTLEIYHEARFASRDYSSLEDVLGTFLAGDRAMAIEAACFGIAGPVLNGVANATNLGWRIEERLLSEGLGVESVRLLNDVEAAAYGMLRLKEEEVVVLNSGPKQAGNVAVVAAGTGLGEAFLYWDGVRHHAIATEGGHTDFAPGTEQEIELLRYLRNRNGRHVSYERVLSGTGLCTIYDFLRESTGRKAQAWLNEALRSGNPAAVITRTGLSGGDVVCVEALALFARIYGAEAGNMALKCLARGGVYLGGGIAPRILPVLQNGAFMDGFTDKGRFSDMLRGIRVCVAINARTPLLGAAYHALALVDADVQAGSQKPG